MINNIKTIKSYLESIQAEMERVIAEMERVTAENMRLHSELGGERKEAARWKEKYNAK